MIDTPENCLARALVSRTAAEGPMLENARNRHLTSAAAWEGLAHLLKDVARERQLRPAPVRAKGRIGVTHPQFQAFDRWENEGGRL